MKAWWENLTARERLMLKGLAAVAGLFALLQLVIAPIGGWRAASEQRERSAETAYRLVAEAAAQGSRAAASAGAEQTPVRAAVRNAAATNGVVLSFINERPDGAVETQAMTAAPERLFAMLDMLERRHGVRVISADIARLGESAVEVRAQLTFAR